MTRIAAALVLALAVLVRGLIPSGWMPSPSGGPLIICSAQAPGHGHLGDKPTGPAKDAAHEGCVFAAAATAPPPDLAIELRAREGPAAVPPPNIAVQSGAPVTPRLREQSPRAPPLKV
jgi:hypothetical protein